VFLPILLLWVLAVSVLMLMDRAGADVAPPPAAVSPT
jgi:hypothetical protein